MNEIPIRDSGVRNGVYYACSVISILANGRSAPFSGSVKNPPSFSLGEKTIVGWWAQTVYCSTASALKMEEDRAISLL